jgi:hypothetical protein
LPHLDGVEAVRNSLDHGEALKQLLTNAAQLFHNQMIESKVKAELEALTPKIKADLRSAAPGNVAVVSIIIDRNDLGEGVVSRQVRSVTLEGVGDTAVRAVLMRFVNTELGGGISAAPAENSHFDEDASTYLVATVRGTELAWSAVPYSVMKQSLSAAIRSIKAARGGSESLWEAITHNLTATHFGEDTATLMAARVRIGVDALNAQRNFGRSSVPEHRGEGAARPVAADRGAGPGDKSTPSGGSVDKPSPAEKPSPSERPIRDLGPIGGSNRPI